MTESYIENHPIFTRLELDAIVPGDLVDILFANTSYGSAVKSVGNIQPEGEIDVGTVATINQSGCDMILVVGCAVDGPEERLVVSEPHVQSSHRFFCKDGYEAAMWISEWITARDGRFSIERPIVVPERYPSRALLAKAQVS